MVYFCIEVFEGSSSSGPLLGTYCGTEPFLKFRSSSNALHVQFSTDNSGNAKVFAAGFSQANSKYLRSNKLVSGQNVNCPSKYNI